MPSIIRTLATLTLGIVLGVFLAGPLQDWRLMMAPPSASDTAQEAWRDFTERMHALGNRILQDDFPSQTDRDRAEGIRQLAHMIVEGLRWEFDHADPEFTGLLVNNTDITGYGGPNVDNKYFRARIDGQSTYIFTGNANNLHDLAIQTTAGDLSMGKMGASTTLDLSQLDTDEEGNFQLVISPEPHEGNWLAQGDDHTIFSLRAYYLDWSTHSDGEFYLVRDGKQGLAPPQLTEREATRRLANAAHWIEASLVGWDKWLKLALINAEDNKANGPRTVDGGSTSLSYGSVPFNLNDGQALIIEIDDPQASYYSFQTYNYAWFDAGDYANRQTSLNNSQLQADQDGKTRIVVSAQDPGVSNWIDTEARQRGMVTYRYMHAGNSHQPRVKLIDASELSQQLPADTVRVSSEERRQQIMVRQKHVQHRFHN